MLTSVVEFIRYFKRVRARTLHFIEALPAERLDWSPQAGEYTCGDIARHLAAVERMDVEAALGAGWHYGGHDRALADDLTGMRAYLAQSHTQAMARLGTLPDAELAARRADLEGNPVAVWRILMAMVEHEVHHRSQLATYLALMGIRPPQLFGVHMEALPRD